jgi:cell division protein FtsN
MADTARNPLDISLYNDMCQAGQTEPKYLQTFASMEIATPSSSLPPLMNSSKIDNIQNIMPEDLNFKSDQSQKNNFSIDRFNSINTPLSDEYEFFLQLGSFYIQSNADDLKFDLIASGFNANVDIGKTGESIIYRVRLGPYPTVQEAIIHEKKLSEFAFKAIIVKRKALVRSDSVKKTRDWIVFSPYNQMATN